MSDPQTPRTPQTWTELDRLAALRSLEVIHTEPESDFDEIARLASAICETPIALVSLVEEDIQWFKARVGLDVCETDRSLSFCDQAMRGHDIMVVPDASLDPRFKDNALVTGEPNIRFYAGAPLITSAGLPLGSLCVIDTTARPGGLTPVQTQTLSVLARQVVVQLELRQAVTQRDRSEEAVRRALAASDHIGAWDWHVPEDKVVADTRMARMFGVDPARATAGLPIAEFTACIHPDDRTRVSEAIQTAIEGTGDFISEYRVVQPNGAERWLLARGQVYAAPDGTPLRFPGLAVDITDKKVADASLARATQALAESEAKFRAIADSLPQMVWSTLPDGFHDYYNARWYEYTGVPEGSTDGEGWNGMFHAEDQERAWAAWRHSLETGEPYEIEYRLRRADGVYRWTLGRATPIRNAEGQITRWFGTCTDIDDLKKLEQGKDLVSQELSHRIKNIFAVISALIALSAREHPEAKAFAAAVRNRIGALARAHEFVRPHSEVSRPTVGNTTLHTFLNALFVPYADNAGRPRVLIEGEDAVFDDQAATSVALLFHELATNAAKYGALSMQDGRVLLTTRAEGERFILCWTEVGGPLIAGEPERAGFGSSLATLSVEGQLGGRLERTWKPEGLVVEADIPATALSRRRAALKLA